MAYASNILKDNIENQFFVRMKPRILTLGTEHANSGGWTLVSGSGFPSSNSIYSRPFTFGKVIGITSALGSTVPGYSLTAATSATGLANKHYFFDEDAQLLYARDDNDDLYFIVEFELFLSTKECLWYSDPTDSTTAVVQWHGCIEIPPSQSLIADLQNFGFIPVDNTTLKVANDTDLFQGMLHDSSFNLSEVICWHQCGNMDADNIQMIFNGVVNGRVKWTPSDIAFDISDKMVQLDETFTYGGDGSNDFYNSSTFGSASHNLDPSASGQPIRMVYGIVKGFVPVNIDYNSDSPSTSNNRNWVVGAGQGVGSWDSYSATIIGSHSTNGFTIAKADAKFFGIGDRIWIDKGTDQWATITDIVDNTSNTIISTDATLSGTLAAMTVKKSFVRNIFLVDTTNKKWEQLEYGRDYTEATWSQNTSGFTLLSTAESNAGIGTFDPGSFKIFCTIAGKQTLPTINSADFDQSKNTDYSTHTVSSTAYRNCYGAFNRVAIVIYDFLKNEFGLSESDIDTAAFTTLDSVLQNPVNFAIPQRSTDSFPTYKDILNTLLLSAFSKAYFNESGKLTIKTIQQISSADQSVNKEDMFASSIEYDYTNLARVNWRIDHQEEYISLTYRALIGLDDKQTHFTLLEDVWGQNGVSNFYGIGGGGGDESSGVSLTTFGAFLHNITKKVDIDTYLGGTNYNSSSNLINFYFQRIYGERSSKMTFKTKTLLSERSVGDSIQVTRNDLPGFAPGSDNSRYFDIVKVQKGDSEVTVILDDQVGVQATYDF